jgi:hypothetical protein
MLASAANYPGDCAGSRGVGDGCEIFCFCPNANPAVTYSEDGILVT